MQTSKEADLGGEEQIPQFALTDYLSEDGEPYRWLYEHSENAYKFACLKTMMAQVAKNLGVPNFAGLLRAYTEAMDIKKPAYEVAAETEFPGQPFALKCGEYICDERGVLAVSPFGGLVTVCAHPIMPVKRLVNIDTGEVKIEIAYNRGMSGWQRAVFDKDTLANSRSITKLSSVGISVTSESAKELVKYLAFMEDANYDTIPYENSVDHLGWTDGYGFSPYIANLSYDNGDRFANEFSCITSKGDASDWFDLAKRVRASRKMEARIVLAASFASALVKPLHALPFIVHLWGSASGTGKTVAMMLAASVWGNPALGKGYVKQMNGTAVGLEQSAAFCRDIPLPLDELQLIQDNKKNFDQFIYMLCEGSTKMRGMRSGGLQRTLSWHNVILTTGEQPITSPNSRSGATNRVIEFECTERVFDEEVRPIAQFIQGNFGHAGRLFVEGLMQEDQMKEAEDANNRFYEELNGASTEKQVLSASVLLAADYMADKLLFHDGNSLTVSDIMPYLVTRESADVNKAAYEWLLDWAVQNTNRFVPVNGIYPGECWGRYGDDSGNRPLDGQKATTLCIIASVFENAMANQGFNGRAFRAWAYRKGLLLCDGDGPGRTTKTIRLTPETLSRCICIRLNTDLQTGFDIVEVADDEIPF